MAESNYRFPFPQYTYGVTGYPTTHFQSALIPMNLSKSSDEEFEMYCETCNRDGKRMNACAFCTSCLSFFCNSCLKSHEKFLLGHKYVDGKDMPKDICLEKCKLHSREIVKFYCENCKVFACSVCKGELHVGTCSMKYLPDFVKDIEKEEDYKDLLTKKESLSKRIEDMRTEENIKQKRINNLHSSTKRAIEKEKQKLFSDFDEEIDKFEADIKERKGKNSNRVITVQGQAMHMSFKIDRLTREIKKIPSSPKSEKYKIFIEMKQLRKEIKEYEDKPKESYSIDDNTFESDAMESMNTLTERVQRFGIYMRECRDRYQEEMTKTSSHIEDIKVKVATDTVDCCITDCFLLSDKYLVVCDKSNKKIKLVNLKSKKVTFVRQLWTVPLGIARIDDSQFMVLRKYESDGDKSVIQFLTFKDAKELVFQKRKIITRMHCCAIASYEKNRLIIFMWEKQKGEFQILNLHGEILETIEFSTESSERIFRCPSSVTVDIDGDLAYVSDWYRDKVFIIDLADYTCTEISTKVWHPQGVAVDEDGSIFIVESGTNSIQYIDSDGNTKNVLIESKSDDFRPLSITYSIEQNKLYVGQERQNCIKVYKINDNCKNSVEL